MILGLVHRARTWRRARRAWRDPFYGACQDCDHDWREHPGGCFADPEFDACGECGYEVDHGERVDPLCRRPAAPPPDREDAV